MAQKNKIRNVDTTALPFGVKEQKTQFIRKKGQMDLKETKTKKGCIIRKTKLGVNWMKLER